jgi:outer membrane protein TolC
MAALAGAPDELDLQGWIDLAMANSPETVRVQACNLQAEASFVSARSALLPRLTVSASGGRTWSETDDDLYSVGISLSQPVPVLGGRADVQALRAAALGITQAGIQGESAVLELQRSVAGAYFQAVEAAWRVRAADVALNRSASVLARVEMLSGMGSMSELELAEARLDEAERRLAVLERTREYGESLETLRCLAGVPSDRGLAVDTAAVPVPLDYREAVELLETDGSSPELESARLDLERAELEMSSASASRLPSLSLGGSAGWTGDEPDLGTDRVSWSVNANLSWPLFDGFQGSSRATAARAAWLSAGASLKAAENEIESGTAAAGEALLTSVRNLELAETRLDLAIRKEELANLEYGAGSLSVSELLSAQTDLAEAESGRMSAVAECLAAELDLLALLGAGPRTGN